MAIMDQRRSAIPGARSRWSSRTGSRRSAIYDPDFYPAGGRPPLVPHLADGVPARGDPAARRLHRVPDPRPVDHRGPYRGRGRPGLQNACRHRGVRVVEGSGTCESGFVCPFHGWCYGAGRHQYLRLEGADLLRAQSAVPATSTSPRCAARCGEGARGSISTTTHRRCGSASSPSPPPSTPGRWSRSGPSGGTRSASRSTGSWPRRRSSSSTT